MEVVAGGTEGLNLYFFGIPDGYNFILHWVMNIRMAVGDRVVV